jgi:hypothetical protein
MNTFGKPRFSLGQVVISPRALKALRESGQTPEPFLARHAHADWGEVRDETKELNAESLLDGHQILSIYTTLNGEEVVVLTDAIDSDGRRPTTKLLLDEEYGRRTSINWTPLIPMFPTASSWRT